jgi:hypothetical protein
MLFKNNNSSDINEDQIALIEYAQSRIKSKKRLLLLELQELKNG